MSIGPKNQSPSSKSAFNITTYCRELKNFQKQQIERDDEAAVRGRIPQHQSLNPSEVRLIVNEETDKIHKLLVDDVSAL